MNVFVVIPGFNEEKYLETVLKKVLKVTKNVVYVDDGSQDSSPKIAQKYLDHVLALPINLGKGAAMKAGCEFAFDELHADAVVFLDSDDQHDASELPNFFAEFNKGSQVVFGVRKFTADMPLLRFLGNKLASVIINVLFGHYIPDIPSGYKGFTKKAYKDIAWKSRGYDVEAEIAARVAKHKIPFTIVNIETIYHDADKGMTLLDALRISFRLLEWRIIL